MKTNCKGMPASWCAAILIGAVCAHAQDPSPTQKSPHYPAPVSMSESLDLPPLQLLGIDLGQNGTAITDPRPTLNGMSPLVITASWLPSIRLTASVPFEVTFWDHLSLIAHVHAFRAGPEANAEPWEVGSVYRQQFEIPMDAVTRQFSGKGYIVIAPQQPASRQSRLAPQQLLHVTIGPRIVDTVLSPAALARVAPTAATPLQKHIRLGFGSEVELQAPPEWPQNITGLGVVSSLSYREVPQGQAVCRIVINAGAEDEQTAQLISGTMTSRCDYDLFKSTELNHQRASIFESRDSALLNADGRPTLLHTYYGTVRLEKPAATIRTLTIVCESESIVDVNGFIPLTENE